MSLELSSLNPAQLKAVTWREGALLVLAGPGSGKTKVLTMRAAKLVEDEPSARSRILALTFTVKAAGEMAERLESMLPKGRERVRTSTFHAFAAEILRQHGAHVRLAPNFEIISDDAERLKILDSLDTMRQAPHEIGDDKGRALGLLDVYTERAWDVESAARALKNRPLAEFVDSLSSEYVEVLTSANLLDFPNLIGQSTRLLRTYKGVASLLHTTYTNVLVDEFQDTNRGQLAFLKELVGLNAERVFAVGDDDQVMYQWNGASPNRMNEFVKMFGASVIQLPTNYRCPAPIVQLANSLISYNSSRTGNKEALVAVSAAGPDSVRTHIFNDVEEELTWIAEDIVSRKLDRSQVALLCRSNKMGKLAVARLQEAGISCVQPLRKGDFSSALVRAVTQIIRAANSPDRPDQVDKAAIALSDLTGTRPNTELARQLSLQNNTSALREMLTAVAGAHDGDELGTQLCRFALSHLLDRMELKQFIERSIQAGLAHANLLPAEDATRDELAEDSEILLGLLRAWTRKYQGSGSLSSFVQEVQLSPKSPKIPENTVLCLTVHTAKGLEFDHVYLFGLVEGQFPSFQAVKAGDHSAEMEEERRNCFVAVTRAAKTLTVTWAKRYFGFNCNPSRFISEMGLTG